MLVIDSIELVLGNEPLKMRELERDYTVRSQQVRHSRGEIIEIGHLRQHVVADDKVSPAALQFKLLCEVQAKEPYESGNILLERRFRHIGGRLDASHRNSHR